MVFCIYQMHNSTFSIEFSLCRKDQEVSAQIVEPLPHPDQIIL